MKYLIVYKCNEGVTQYIVNCLIFSTVFILVFTFKEFVVRDSTRFCDIHLLEDALFFDFQVVGKVPHLVSQLRTEKTNGEFILRFTELMQCLMQLHPGYPDLYEPVLEALKVTG